MNWWKDMCSEFLEASPFKRKKLAKDLEIIDDEVQSRYEKVHSDQGLCFALVEVFNTMAELRLKAEYGDYLAYTCLPLKGPNMDDLIWKTEKLDWQAVAKNVKEEEIIRRNDRYYRRPVFTPTPYLDDIAKAASRLGYEESLVRYQIIAYAQRNDFCHSGIKGLICDCDWHDLGKKIIEDKRALELIFRGRPHDQIEMRNIIKLVEREWFSKLWVNEKTGSGVKYCLTEKGMKKQQSQTPENPGTELSEEEYGFCSVGSRVARKGT